MLLTDARRAARTGADGALIPLAEQDRRGGTRRSIDEGVALVTDTLPTAPLGPYQLQAAIAAVHDEAPTADETDWPQVLALYGLLDRIAPEPDGHAQPGRRGRDGATGPTPASSCSRPSTTTAGSPTTTASSGARPPARDGGRRGRGPRGVPRRGPSHDERTGAALPRGRAARLAPGDTERAR